MRGVVVLWETMALGMRALNYSSRIAFEEDTDENGEPAEFPEKVFFGTMALALVFVVGIFFAGPILLGAVVVFRVLVRVSRDERFLQLR